MNAKIILYKAKVYKDGTHPIIVQIVVNRKAVRKVIARIKPDQWLTSQNRVSEKKHPGAAGINSDIDLLLRKLSEAKTESDAVQFLKGKEADTGSFTSFYEDEIHNYRMNGQASKYITHGYLLEQLHTYAGSTNIQHGQITEKFIKHFGYWLGETRGNNANTIHEKMACLSTIVKRARKKKLIIADPFIDLSFKTESTIKNKLTVTEFNTFRTASIPDKWDEERDFFVTAVYLRGIRMGDLLLLKPSNFDNGFISYIEGKTGQVRRFAVRPEVAAIIERYKRGPDDYIFSFLKWKYNPKLSASENSLQFTEIKKRFNTLLRYRLIAIAKYAGVNKNISSHIARHTFGKMTIDKVKNPRISMGLLGHKSLSAHETYITDIKDDTELDDAADSVFDE